MSDHTYKVIEIVGTSSECIEEAVNNAINRCGQTVHNMRWFEVINTRGDISNGHLRHWQVTLKVGFTIDSE